MRKTNENHQLMNLRLFMTGAMAACAVAVAVAQTDGLPRAAQTEDCDSTAAATLSLPLSMPVPAFSASPFGWDIPGSWRLHEGFNAQFSLSVSTAFGRHALRGVGFGQEAAFAYALPLTDRLSFAAGICAGNLEWGGLRRTEVGLAGILTYRVNDAVSLSAYASKSLVPRYRYPLQGGLPLYLPGGGDRIGAMAEFKVGKNAAVQISVEHCSDSFVPPSFGIGGMKPYGW